MNRSSISAAASLLIFSAPVLAPLALGAGPTISERLPRVVYQGGPFLRRPRVVTVTFAGDDPALVARLERFGETIARTSWWRDSVADFCASESDCIGEGQAGLAVRLDDALPARIHGVDVASLLRRAASAGRLGTLGPESVLLVYVPAGVVLFDAFHEHFCGDGPRAFHRALRWEGGVNGYSVIPRCGDEAAITATASHELVEIATNPDTQARGFAFELHSRFAGFTVAGIEPMDPCGILTRAGNRTFADGFAVQRAWSNRAAAEGADPCGTTPEGQPYLALVPREPVVRLREPGARATLVLDAVASLPSTQGLEWKIAVVDLTGDQDGERYLDAALDRVTTRAGESVSLSLELLERHANETTVIGLLSTLDGRTYLWPLAVRMR